MPVLHACFGAEVLLFSHYLKSVMFPIASQEIFLFFKIACVHFCYLQGRKNPLNRKNRFLMINHKVIQINRDVFPPPFFSVSMLIPDINDALGSQSTAKCVS